MKSALGKHCSRGTDFQLEKQGEGTLDFSALLPVVP